MKAGKRAAIILSMDARAGLSERWRLPELPSLGVLAQAADPFLRDPDPPLIDD
jgi:hypothetical protein